MYNVDADIEEPELAAPLPQLEPLPTTDDRQEPRFFTDLCFGAACARTALARFAANRSVAQARGTSGTRTACTS
jgi:hypothetical protein